MSQSNLRSPVPVWLVGVGMAFAFGAGFLARDVGSAGTSATQPAAEQLGQVGTVSAPPLTQEQLAGTLPAGHPGFATTGPATTGPAATGGTPAAPTPSRTP